MRIFVSKEKLLVLFFILTILFSKSVISIGLSPADVTIYYEPNKEETITYSVRNTMDSELNASLYLNGNLSKYFSLSDNSIYLEPKETKQFKLSYKLPEKLEPGVYTIYLYAVEIKSPEKQGIGARGAVVDKIKIRVPEHGKYITAVLKADDVEVNKTALFHIKISNFGEEEIHTLSADVTVFTLDNKTIATVRTNTAHSLKTFNTVVLEGMLNTKGMEESTYRAVAKVYYDEKTKETNYDNFRVGSVDVEIVNFTKKIYSGLINKFNISVRNKWNTKISVSGEVIVRNNSKELSVIKFVEETMNPWETKTLTSFIDATNIPIGSYDMEVNVIYNGKTKTRFASLNVVEKPREGINLDYKKLFLISTITILIVIMVVLILFTKNKTKRRNGKNKIIIEKNGEEGQEIE